MRYLSALAIVALACSCVPEVPYKINREIVPATLSDGWAIASAADAGIDPDALARAYDSFLDENNFQSAKSLIVIRHGAIVAENYCRSIDDRDIPGHLQSATKGITALAYGIARGRHDLSSLDTLLYDILPGSFDGDTRKRAISLRHLLTMQSGLAMNNFEFAVEILVKRNPDPLRDLLALPLYATPGDSFLYRDVDAHLAASALRSLCGETVEDIVQSGIFAPLGITSWAWERDASGNPIGSNALALRPRDLGKIGKLVLQKGFWEGEQLIDTAWIDSMTNPHTDIRPEADFSGFQYGWFWWIVPELAAFTAWGHGGQFVFIVPDRDLVIVMTSMPDSNEEGPGTSLHEFLPLARTIIGGCR